MICNAVLEVTWMGMLGSVVQQEAHSPSHDDVTPYRTAMSSSARRAPDHAHGSVLSVLRPNPIGSSWDPQPRPHPVCLSRDEATPPNLHTPRLLKCITHDHAPGHVHWLLDQTTPRLLIFFTQDHAPGTCTLVIISFLCAYD